MDLDWRRSLKLCLASNYHRFIVSNVFHVRCTKLRPLFRKKNVTLDYYDMWKIDVDSGLVSTPSTAKRYEAEDAHISGRAGNAIVLDVLLISLTRL
jgi:hypothetical protein